MLKLKIAIQAFIAVLTCKNHIFLSDKSWSYFGRYSDIEQFKIKLDDDWVLNNKESLYAIRGLIESPNKKAFNSPEEVK